MPPFLCEIHNQWKSARSLFERFTLRYTVKTAVVIVYYYQYYCLRSVLKYFNQLRLWILDNKLVVNLTYHIFNCSTNCLSRLMFLLSVLLITKCTRKHFHLIVPLCTEGEQWNGTDCEKCPMEHYKDVKGNNVTCQVCPVNETAPDVGYINCGKSSLFILCYKNILCLHDDTLCHLVARIQSVNNSIVIKQYDGNNASRTVTHLCVLGFLK